MDFSASFEAIASAIGRFIMPVEERLESGQVRLLLAELGMDFPPELDSQGAFTTALGQAASTARQLFPVQVDLVKAVADEDTAAVVTKGLELVNLLTTFVDDAEQLKTALSSAGGALPGLTQAQVDAFAAELPQRLFDYLVVRQIEGVPTLAGVAELAGIVEREEVTENGLTYFKRSLKLDRLGPSLTSPGAHLQSLYGWGLPAFDGAALLEKLEKILVERGVPAILDTSVNPPVLDVLFFEIQADTSASPPGLELRFGNHLNIDDVPAFQQDAWKIELGFGGELDTGAALAVRPDGTTTFTPPTGEVAGKTFVRWTAGSPTAAAFLVLGEAGGSRVEVRQAIVEGCVGLVWDASAGAAAGDLAVGGEIIGGKLVIDFSDGDGFLSQILAGVGLESDFDFGFGVSASEGIHFHGSSTLDIQLPLHVSLGVVELNGLVLTVGIDGTTFPIGLALTIRANLGPLQAVVEEIGVVVDLSLPPDRQGALGPVDFALRFQPPKGVGLSLDVGIVKGGGYLYFNTEREEYAGALELTFADFLSLKAIGLITTKMPDGSTGFSMIIIITAEFGAGLQLGYGFTLLGVGGLLGLNRTVRIDQLAQGVRTGAVESVLFPQDIIANAPRIISDLRTFFPPQEGVFLIGPMAKLGWGTPTLISLSLGVIVEIPGGNIVILGIFKIALPHEDAALLVIQVNFIGAIEPDKQRAWFYAQLFESRVLFITIEGGMGLLFAWGADAEFIASIGGFHPRYDPPPLPFDEPPHLSFNLLNTPVAQVRVEGYFAVTSNTVQFGARVNVFFGLSAVNVQGHVGFDALFQFSPFYFVIEISASLSANVLGVGLFSVRVHGTLEGPTPWHIQGTGSISLLFFDVDVDFSETWGETSDTSLPPIAVLPILSAEYEKVDNWRAELPQAKSLHVSLRKVDAAAELVLHPVGSLRVSQRAVPLDLKIDKVGSQTPSDANRFSLSVGTGGFTKKADVPELFAKAQFVNLTDSQKLDLPAFEPITGGAELFVATDDTRAGNAVKRVVRYESHIIDTNYKRFTRVFTKWFGSLFEHFLAGNATARAEVSASSRQKLDPFEEKIAVKPEGFAVAFARDNTPYAGQTVTFASSAAAHQFLQDEIAVDANFARDLHVIPSYEVNAGAA